MPNSHIRTTGLATRVVQVVVGVLIFMVMHIIRAYRLSQNMHVLNFEHMVLATVCLHQMGHAIGPV